MGSTHPASKYSPLSALALLPIACLPTHRLTQPPACPPTCPPTAPPTSLTHPPTHPPSSLTHPEAVAVQVEGVLLLGSAVGAHATTPVVSVVGVGS
jgi:hypothetical protein